MASLSIADLYASSPLDSNQQQQIRVLDLHPGRYGEELSGTLRIVCTDPDSQPIYEALSYTWGTSEKCCAINLNGSHTLPITRNLSNALQRLKRRHEFRTLWVDAVCIDQKDVEEKTAQVALMSQVYRRASCVNVWLGEPMPDALSYQHNGTDRTENVRGAESQKVNADKSSSNPFELVGGVNHSIAQALASNPPGWHGRMWTVQEFVLAKQVIFCWGTAQLAYDEAARQSLEDAEQEMISAVVRRKPGYASAEFFWMLETSIDLVKQAYWRDNGMSLYFALLLLEAQKATDPRDKVYAVLGLLAESDSMLIKPDYGMSWEETYARATYALIQSRCSLDVFGSLRSLPLRTPELPSWSLEFGIWGWASHILKLRLFQYGDDEAFGFSTGTGGVELDDSGRKLILPGHDIDSIGSTVSLPGYLSNPELEAHICTWLSGAGLDGTETACNALPQPLPSVSSDTFERRLSFLSDLCRSWDTHTSRIRGDEGEGQPERRRLLELRIRRVLKQYSLWNSDSFMVFVTARGRVGFGPTFVQTDDDLIATDNPGIYLVLRPVGGPEPELNGKLNSGMTTDTLHALISTVYVETSTFENQMHNEDRLSGDLVKHYCIV